MTFTTLRWPCQHAYSMGVHPLRLGSRMSPLAPCSNSHLTTSRCPFQQACKKWLQGVKNCRRHKNKNITPPLYSHKDSRSTRRSVSLSADTTRRKLTQKRGEHRLWFSLLVVSRTPLSQSHWHIMTHPCCAASCMMVTNVNLFHDAGQRSLRWSS